MNMKNVSPSASLRPCLPAGKVCGNFILSALFCTLTHAVNAQNPPPASPQSKSILIASATAHIGNGKVIENSVIGFKDGKITLVADATLIKLQKGAYDTIINASGKHVYPGLIALNTNLGLSEIELVRATRDFNETGKLNPSARSIIAYNTDSKVIPTVRCNGVLLAQIVPQGGLISGQSSVVELDGWNWEDAAYKTDAGIHLNWPNMNTNKMMKEPTEEEQKKNIEKDLADLKKLFDDARSYFLSGKTDEKNLHLEAMKGIFDGTKKLFIHANNIKQIVAAVNFCKEYKMSFVLVGGDDAWRVTGLLAENKIPVVIGRTHALPHRQDEDVDIAFKLPFLLHKAGILFCNSVEGFWQVRNLSYNTGTDVAYGLTKEEALAAITLSPARILGIDSTVGSLEEGKDATLFASDGDILDMRTSEVSMAFIRGKEINLDNVQSQLYRKYAEKFQLKK